MVMNSDAYDVWVANSTGRVPWTSVAGKPWFLRETLYSEPKGDYTAGCWMTTRRGWDNDIGFRFNDYGCKECFSDYLCSTNNYRTPTPAPTTSTMTSHGWPTLTPTTTLAPTKRCLSDSFDGTVLGPQWTYPAGGDGECVLSGNGTLICRSAGNGAHIRTTDTFMAPLTISASLEKTEECSNHYIKVSTESSDSGDSWTTLDGTVTFVWNCNTRTIYGQTWSVSTPCSSFQTYDIEITVNDSMVTFRDTAGTCGDLSLSENQDTGDEVSVSGTDDEIGASVPPLYVCIGAYADANADNTTWDSVDICSSAPTAAPTLAPTLAPTPCQATLSPSWEQVMTPGTISASGPECTSYNAWRASLTGAESSITMTANGAEVACTDPIQAAAIAAYIRDWTPLSAPGFDD
jgi:hypothetical protein